MTSARVTLPIMESRRAASRCLASDDDEAHPDAAARRASERSVHRMTGILLQPPSFPLEVTQGRSIGGLQGDRRVDYDPHDMNHWATAHDVCGDCPTSRKDLARVLTTMIVVDLVGLGAWALWHSPTLFRLGGAWVLGCSPCVDARARSETLGDRVSSRRLCAQCPAHGLEPSP